MVSFPAIAPVYPASEGTLLPESKILLGDGYKRLLSFGLNTVKPEWRLEWLVNQSSADAIDLFLQSCADNSEFFQWQPPDASSELNWKCEEWSVEQQAYDLYSIKATFKRIFELSINQLIPTIDTCTNDYLCEPDYGLNNQADFWLSRITAPISNLDPNTYGTDTIVGHGIVMDDQGYSYHVWCHDSYYENPGYGWIVITKRDLGGNIVWTKRTSLSMDASWLLSVDLHDYGDGLGKTLNIIARTNYGYGQFGGLSEMWHATFSLSGSFIRAFTSYFPFSNINLRLSASSYLAASGNLVCSGINPGGIYCFYQVMNSTSGATLASWTLRQPGTIYASPDIGTDGGVVEFTSTKALAIFNIGGNRLQISRLNNYTPESTALFITWGGSAPGGGSYATVVKYENTALVFIGAYIYQFDQDGNFMRRITFSGDWAGLFNARWGVKLDEDNGNIYINSGASVYTLSYDLSTVKTLTQLSPGGNNYAGRNGTLEGNGNMLSLNANRFVLSMDTFAGYGQSASGGRALLMAAGGRLSEIGSLVSMNAGGFTATAVGYSVNQATTSTTSVTSYVQQSMLISGDGTSTGANRTTTLNDATSIYQWGLYSTQYS